MPPIKIDRVVSVSSEDPVHSSANLLKDEFNNKKWKSCGPGEKRISVVLQFVEPYKITSIDIGNENSAFVEVLAAKSSSGGDDFRVLLAATSLMSLKEAKFSTNTNGVTFIKTEELCKDARLEKWDRVKIVCTQPFNSIIQFGLSFVVFHTDSGSEAPDLGRFHLKSPDSSQKPSTWALLAKQKERTPDNRGAAAVLAAGRGAEIRLPTSKYAPVAAKLTALSPSDVTDQSDSVPTTSSSSTSTTRRNGKLSRDTPRLTAKDYEDIDDFLADSGSEFEPESESEEDDDDIGADDDVQLTPVKTRKPKKVPDKTSSKTPKRPKPGGTNSGSSSEPRPKTATLNNFPARPRKPFNRLMDDVVFVISGFQNPLRSDIRSSALAMGAKYKADWDRTCTHLVCAFRNTPKFNQVRGSGKIIKKDWVECCYESRKRFPWRRYALDPQDQSRAESEDEIWEDTGPPPTPIDNRRRLNDSSSEDDDVEREVKRIKRAQNNSAKVVPSTRGAANISLTEDEPAGSSGSGTPKAGPSTAGSPAKVPRKPSPPQPSITLSVYDMDTEDDDSNGCNDILLDLPPMPPYFEDFSFLVLDDIPSDEGVKLKRFISARLGHVISNMNELGSSKSAYCISEDSARYNEVREAFPNVIGAKPDWIWFCHDENCLRDVGPYAL